MPGRSPGFTGWMEAPGLNQSGIDGRVPGVTPIRSRIFAGLGAGLGRICGRPLEGREGLVVGRVEGRLLGRVRGGVFGRVLGRGVGRLLGRGVGRVEGLEGRGVGRGVGRAAGGRDGIRLMEGDRLTGARPRLMPPRAPPPRPPPRRWAKVAGGSAIARERIQVRLHRREPDFIGMSPGRGSSRWTSRLGNRPGCEPLSFPGYWARVDRRFHG